MLNFDVNKMLFNIPKGEHSRQQITDALAAHPDVRFVSFVGIDIGGHDTDEKIPVALFVKDMEKMNYAASLGWLVFHFIPDEMFGLDARNLVSEAIKLRQNAEK